MFLISFSNSCILSNSTRSPVPSSPIYSYMMILFSILASLANGVSVIILSRPNSSQRFGQIRLNLLILSISETSLNAFIALFNALNILNINRFSGIVALWIETLLFWNITSLICNRNWIVVLIACSRCEIVFLPFHSLSGLKFNNKVIRNLSILIFIISYLLSSVRLFSIKAIICTNTGVIEFKPHLIHRWEYIFYETYCFFIFQSVLPVLVVAGISAAMTYSLIKEPSPQLIGSGNTQLSQNNNNKPITVRGSSQRKATKTIFVLAIVFTTFEAPVFIIQILMQNGKIPIVTPAIGRFVFFITNFLVVLDSCSNFMVYLVTSDKFRAEFRRLIWRFGCSNSNRQRSVINDNLSVTEQLIVTQSQKMASIIHRICPD